MPTPESRPLSAAILDQAIHWCVRLQYDRPDDDTLEAFESWRSQCPEHEQAWQRVVKLGKDFKTLPPDLTRRTLEGSRNRLNRRQGLKLLLLCTAAGGLGWLGHDRTPLPSLLADHRAAMGERAAIGLEDGSRVLLNSGGAFDVRFDADRRLLVLQHGELLVETGTDTTRPFWVRTRGGYLHALGTRFLVREHGDDQILLSVEQGQVAIASRAIDEAPRHVVGSGEQVLFDRNGLYPTPPDNGLDPWAWTDGVISARDARLDDFLAELSRYRPGLLRWTPAVAGLTVSGTYQLADTDQILALIASTLPIEVQYRSRFWVTVTAGS